MDNFIDQLITAVKELPVDCRGRFDAADAWVGIVIGLQSLKESLVSDSDHRGSEQEGSDGE